MGPLVRAELRKYLTTRMYWGMALAMFVTGALFAAITAAFIIYGSIDAGGNELDLEAVLPELTLARMVYTGGIQIGYLLALVIGVVAIGTEFRHKTATSTFLAAPRRSRVILAKAAALVLIAVGSGLFHVIGSLIGGGVLLGLNDLAVLPDAAQLGRTLLLALLVLALWALMGLGIGVLITNQVAALFVAVAVAWIVEPLLGWGLTFLDSGDAFARFFPSQATTATLDVFTGADEQVTRSMGGSGEQLPWWGAALTLVAYAGVMTVIGVWLTRRRDIA
ncbi:MAG: ABC transporter permease [Actinomycetota bacterium]|nr:ABC transporter permease [Actinomycetota bacterium]